MVIWLIGLSGAGKTTIGRLVYNQIKAKQINTVFVDGDEIRALFKHDNLKKDYSVEQRRRNAERIFEICLWLDRQGINVVCCILCIFPDILELNKTAFSHYREIYLKANLTELISRDTKDVYVESDVNQPSNVVGLDIAFPEPVKPDLTINTTDNSGSPEELAAQVFAILQTP
jgi:adenylylsulfate kinase-like enzyme